MASFWDLQLLIMIRNHTGVSLRQVDLSMSRDSRPSAGRQLLLKAVNRVWTELMHSKRQMLEDIFKVSLPCNDRGHVDIATARPALEEPALKSWQNHLGKEGSNRCELTSLHQLFVVLHRELFNLVPRQ